MQHAFRTKWVLATLALGAAISSGALLAQDNTAGAAGGGVTIVNNSKHAIQLFARYGGGDDCTYQPNQVELQVAAGTSGTVDSGSSKVCFCLEVPSRNSCPAGWGTIKAGGKRVFQ